jgi:hypothetical protein
VVQVLTTEEVVVAWKAMWKTASPCSNPHALGGVPENVREDIEGGYGPSTHYSRGICQGQGELNKVEVK